MSQHSKPPLAGRTHTRLAACVQPDACARSSDPSPTTSTAGTPAGETPASPHTRREERRPTPTPASAAEEQLRLHPRDVPPAPASAAPPFPRERL